MLNILLLMAGRSDAFKEAGYEFPKNLVEIDGAPLIQRVIDGLACLRGPNTQLIYAIRRDENRRFHTGQVVHLLDPSGIVVDVVGETSGAACTALLTIEHINNENPLLIINGDIVLDYDLATVLDDFRKRALDGGVTAFRDVHPRWSFVKVNSEGLAIEFAEKRPISDLATAGLYYYAQGRDFVQATSAMMQKDAHVDGLFYVCPAYNEMILQHKRIGYYAVPKNAYFSLKTPHDVRTFEEHLITKRRQVT